MWFYFKDDEEWYLYALCIIKCEAFYNAKAIECMFVKFYSIPHKSFLRGIFHLAVQFCKYSVF